MIDLATTVTNNKFTLAVSNFNFRISQKFPPTIRKTSVKQGLETIGYCCPQPKTLVPKSYKNFTISNEIKVKTILQRRAKFLCSVFKTFSQIICLDWTISFHCINVLFLCQFNLYIYQLHCRVFLKLLCLVDLNLKINYAQIRIKGR